MVPALVAYADLLGLLGGLFVATTLLMNRFLGPKPEPGSPSDSTVLLQ